MSRTTVDDNHQKKYDRNFFSCEEPYERRYIVDTIPDTFPYFTRESVDRAVEHRCKTIPPPRDRKAFLRCVASPIGTV